MDLDFAPEEEAFRLLAAPQGGGDPRLDPVLAKSERRVVARARQLSIRRQERRSLSGSLEIDE